MRLEMGLEMGFKETGLQREAIGDAVALKWSGGFDLRKEEKSVLEMLPSFNTVCTPAAGMAVRSVLSSLSPTAAAAAAPAKSVLIFT